VTAHEDEALLMNAALPDPKDLQDSRNQALDRSVVIDRLLAA
jgi:hypothetical protein